MTCPHCGRGLRLGTVSAALVLASVVIGTFAGVAVQLPTEGAALGALHAVVPIAWIMEESA